MATRSRALDALAGALRDDAALAAEEHFLVAISGGPDSTALLVGLVRLAPHFGYRLTAAHVAHGLRGAESRRDADAAQAVARQLGVECLVQAAPVPPGGNLEARARQLRYRALRRAARRVHATRIVTGHTQDDQVETVLLRLLRGTGRGGLGGIAIRRGRLLRPLLGATRTDLRRLLSDAGLPVVLDRSNADLAHRRNRVRRLLIPVIESELNPRLGATLSAAARRWRDEDDYLTSVAASQQTRFQKGGQLSIDAGREPAAIARRVVRTWLLAGGARSDGRDIDGVLALAQRRQPGRIDLAHGQTVRSDGSWLYLSVDP